MFGISGEHLLILGIVLIIFGPRRLPELGNTLGKAIRNFKDAISGVEEAKYRKIDDQASPQAGRENKTDQANPKSTTTAQEKSSDTPKDDGGSTPT
jgi:sec-independent protein translocase protein TatA